MSYICSRYYRAPELCYGAQVYSHAIDVWSAGCVLAEMILGTPIFRGATSDDQLAKIIQTDSTPELVVSRMIAEANRHGGLDNITAIVVRIDDV